MFSWWNVHAFWLASSVLYVLETHLVYVLWFTWIWAIMKKVALDICEYVLCVILSLIMLGKIIMTRNIYFVYKSRLWEIDSLVWEMTLLILHSCGWSSVIVALWPLLTTIVSLNLKLSLSSLTFYFLHDLWYRYCFRFLLIMCVHVCYFFKIYQLKYSLILKLLNCRISIHHF